MKIQLSEHFTYKKLLQFVFPSIIMMIFTSIYSVVDGLFVSNFVGKSAFAAVNLIMPFLMGISALGFMIGTGGSAIVAKTLGEGKIENANEYFSMLVYITAIGGIIIAILSMFLVKPVAILFGASGALLDNCILYGRILCISLPAFMLQNVFQSFYVTAEKPHLGLRVIVIAGVTNMVLDFLFVAVLHLAGQVGVHVVGVHPGTVGGVCGGVTDGEAVLDDVLAVLNGLDCHLVTLRDILQCGDGKAVHLHQRALGNGMQSNDHVVDGADMNCLRHSCSPY